MNTDTIALALFGSYYRRRRARFSFLTNDLIKARIYITAERLLSTATLYSLVLSSICITLGLVVLALLSNYVPILGFLFKAEIDPLGLLAYFGLIVFVVLACFLAVFLLFILYPRVKGWERKGKIDGHLSYAICWMSFTGSYDECPLRRRNGNLFYQQGAGSHGREQKEVC